MSAGEPTGRRTAEGRVAPEGAGVPGEATLWDLVTDERVPIEALTAAVDAYLAAPTTRDHPIGSTHVLDLAAAVAAHAPATMADAGADEPARRIAVRAALLMARPTPA